MKNNPVELLTIVNPSESGWTKERWRNFVLFSAVSGIGYSIYRDRMRTASTAEEAQRASSVYLGVGVLIAAGAYFLYGDKLEKGRPERNRNHWVGDVYFEVGEIDGLPAWFAYADGEMIGEITMYLHEPGYKYRLADEWAWSPAESLREAQESLFADYRLGMLEGLHENPAKRARGRYFVRVVKEGVTYPKSGSEYYPGGYTLRKAQDFARIGSQTGGPREVRRGRRGGPRVRTYIKGKRTWPATRAQAKNLLPVEVPKRLRAS